MCGIIYAHKPGGNVSKAVRKRYAHQAARGKQGYGFLPIVNNRIKTVHRAKWEKDSLAQLKETNANEILFHHRHPTSTENLINTTHPFVIKHDMFEHDYYIIHNGVISSTHQDKLRHEKMGISYYTEHQKKEVTYFPHLEDSEEVVMATKHNDSESLAWDVALFMEGIIDNLPFRGAAALIGVQTTKKGYKKGVFFGHNEGRPLVEEIHEGKKGPLYILKSIGNGGDVPEDKLYFRDNKGGITSWDVKIGTFYKPQTATVGYGAHWNQQSIPRTPSIPTTPTPPAHNVHRLPEPSDFNQDNVDDYMDNASAELNEQWDNINDRLADIAYEISGWQDVLDNTNEQSEKVAIRDEVEKLVKEEKRLNAELDFLLAGGLSEGELEVIT